MEPTIAKIIPLKKMPRNIDAFDYLVPEKFIKLIKPGQLVKIPFKNSVLNGIVWQISNKSDFEKIKAISDIQSTLPYLANYQIKLAGWFSENYFYSLASTIKMLTPQPPQKSSKTVPKKHQIGMNKIIIQTKIFELAKKITTGTQKKFLIINPEEDLKIELLIALCEQIIGKKKQLLILLPQISQIQNLLKSLPQVFQNKIAIVNNELFKSKNRYYKTWKLIQTGETSIIIGTRSAIFFNFPNIDLIFCDQADSADYKNWDQTPRYQAIEVAQKIQEFTKCKLILAGNLFRVEDYYLAQKERFKSIKLGGKIIQAKIIDLNEERRQDFTYLSDYLLQRIREKIEKNEKTLLIVNKLGYASYLMCRDCKFIPACPKCHFPLTISNGKLTCRHCNIAEDLALACPKCHGANLIKLGIGLDQIKETIATLFGKNSISENLESNASIYISTAQISDSRIFEKISLMGIVYIDSLMYLPDFTANFRIYQLLKNLMSPMGRKNSEIIIQTCFPDNPAIQFINQPLEKFFNQELTERSSYKYPPYFELIKLIFQHHDREICQKEAINLYEKLISLKIFDSNTLSPPYLHQRQQIRGRYRIQILAKIRPINRINLQQLKTFLPGYWMIDRNPLSVL